MKKYEKPEMNITTLKNTDVITVSGGVALKNGLLDAVKYNEISAF